MYSFLVFSGKLLVIKCLETFIGLPSRRREPVSLFHAYRLLSFFFFVYNSGMDFLNLKFVYP